MYKYSCFTPALLLLVVLCVYVYALLLPYSYFTYVYTRALLVLYYYLSCCVSIYICFTPALLSGLTYNKDNIYNVGIYTCLESCRASGFHNKAV